MKLNVHSNWDRWLSKLLEVTQDYAPVLPLWIFAYERLISDHKFRPPSWVKAWLETKMTTGSMTKDELRVSTVWKLVQTRINKDSQQHDVSEQQDDGSIAPAAAAQEQTDPRQRMTELLEAKPALLCSLFGHLPRTSPTNRCAFKNRKSENGLALPST